MQAGDVLVWEGGEERGDQGGHDPHYTAGEMTYGLLTRQDKGQGTTLGRARRSLPPSTTDSPPRKQR